ncbi:hypothetical protein L2E82_12547 [Cichorium intybus]|uniref:Uncharacterized protein n=1 Tax=Cichorium intybus TaxID=13427 RepID=A0ACB9GFT5_CICIN|nr:hypothetical protein L2E82_12547 [Cichorium intybus]
MDIRKRGWPEAKANGGAKKFKSESKLVGSKSKPCMKFFSMDGCPFGENCHFLHFFPGGYNAVAQMMNLPPTSAPSTTQTTTAPPPATKTKICNKYNTAEGCKFGDKCHFAHGPWEIGKPIAPPPDNPQTTNLPPITTPRFGPPPPVAASFGASATAKISIDAFLAGTIIGKGGVNSKQISRETGAKLSIRDHENDRNLKNIELEGTFDQIKEASAMVRELILSASLETGGGGGPPPGMHHGAPPVSSMGNKKTKLCENFAKGSCTFGDRCHFAHGASELRKIGV